MQKLALLFGLTVLATGLSVRAQDVAAGCQGDNLEFTECADKRAVAFDRLQDRIYHTVMDALIAVSDDAADPFAEKEFGFLRGTLPKSQQQWTRYRHAVRGGQQPERRRFGRCCVPDAVRVRTNPRTDQVSSAYYGCHQRPIEALQDGQG